MAFGTLRTLIYTFCFLQLLSTIERQIFDFLGYMWLPILWNFFHLVFLIFCVFGVHQCQRLYMIAHCVWSILWLGWNTFTICFYLDVGALDKRQDLLSFGTGSFSWWLANGYGCHAEYYQNNASALTEVDEARAGYYPLRPSHVSGCAVEYYYVEVIHASVQLTLTLVVLALVVHFCFLLQTKAGRSQKWALSRPPAPLYSIEYSPRVGEGASLMQETTLYAPDQAGRATGQMTPRRVKRRSHTRGSTRSVSHGSSKGSLARHRRASTRSLGHVGSQKTGARLLLEPSTALPARPLDSSTSADEGLKYGQINPAYESSRPSSLYATTTERPPSTLTSYSNFHGQRKLAAPMGLAAAAVLTQSALNPNVSYDDDLPPPPSPLAASPMLARHDLSSGQVPVPQQRQPARRNEYVNMPVGQPPMERSLPEVPQQPSGPPNPYSGDGHETQTLRAHDRLLVPNGIHGGTRPKTTSHIYRNDPAFPEPPPPGAHHADHGFAPPKVEYAQNGNSEGYYHRHAPPSTQHGGNCKCYRCQRKLTAI
eukprot:snap_masked-scaffold22_size673200-processed-gene-3.14 protein:Tk12683 transcript:snap_masked-scaffold22_size673200-processed-gene-3.14-mRNA-1 annotation:"sodium potassium-transporting atpase subunit beta-1-interacting protein isoform x2"